ncbi:MAG TPA: hypothetical protein VMR50_01850 [Myxococcota bacterium]|jgi:catechol 2,3-dioxygenase-like lactoylglutathione lyase family enzyme|nr:hypothetical protein [Myxococcota bacterium]
MKLRTRDPWMSGPAYAATLRGLSVNLLVGAIEPSLAFARGVLEAEVVYADPDFAVVRGYGSEWMLHADHTYDQHPLGAEIWGVTRRGGGVELRLHGCDPDRAEAAARRLGYRVLESARAKGHGMREVYLLDADGYLWVPDVMIE